ncbi:MAG: helix-turn-helix transcriptional regulator, partial [Oligoflexia bacterium]|nr:helix-turn-helix transcriptional regulator [Oligoflexia bacterium]
MKKLTAQAIQDAALALLEDQGADKLTMRRLAKVLDVEASSLYHHLPSKAVLVDHVIDAVLSQAAALPTDLGWPEHLALLARNWRALLAAHPAVIALTGARPSRFLGLLDPCAPTAVLLEQAGFSADAATDLLRALLVLVVGHADLDQAGVNAPADADRAFDRAVASLIGGSTPQQAQARPPVEAAPRPAP